MNALPTARTAMHSGAEHTRQTQTFPRPRVPATPFPPPFKETSELRIPVVFMLALIPPILPAANTHFDPICLLQVLFHSVDLATIKN